MNYYRHYVGDYLRDTSRLSMLEHGAYRLMLDYVYADERPLPLDVEELYVMVRAMTPADRKAVDKVLARFFVKGDDGYHQARADVEIAKARSTIAKQRESGIESAHKRWGSCGSTDGLDDESTHKSTDESPHAFIAPDGGKRHGSAIQPPITNNQPPTANRQPPTPNHQPEPVLLTPTQEVKGEARAKRLPTTWTPSPDLELWTRNEKPDWTDEDLATVIASFIDHWTAKGERRVDWKATWRNWVRRETKPRRNGSGSLYEKNLAATANWAPPEDTPHPAQENAPQARLTSPSPIHDDVSDLARDLRLSQLAGETPQQFANRVRSTAQARRT